MKEDSILTDFDTLTFSNPTQMLKSVLPYMAAPQQKTFTIFIKMQELRQALSLLQGENNQLSACSVPDESNTMLQILSQIRRFCNAADRDFIDLFLNFSQAFQLYSAYRNVKPDDSNDNSALFDALQNLLTPEQQETFQQYSQIFSSLN